MDRHRSRTPDEAAQEYEYKSWANRERASQGQGPEEGVGGGTWRGPTWEDMWTNGTVIHLYCLSTLSSGVLSNVLCLIHVIRFVIEAEVKSGASRGRRRSRPKKKEKNHELKGPRRRGRRGRRGGGGGYGQSV